MNRITSNRTRKLISLILLILVCVNNKVAAQTPEQDLSKGNYLLMQKPFQLEAISFTHIAKNGILSLNFDTDINASSNFSSFNVWQSE
jgi:hypothetical protein